VGEPRLPKRHLCTLLAAQVLLCTLPLLTVCIITNTYNGIPFAARAAQSPTGPLTRTDAEADFTPILAWTRAEYAGLQEWRSM
jgi:hypothetical protein